jgi:hypothetical protein
VCDLAGLGPSDAEGLQTATLRFYVLHAIREGEPRPLTLYAVSEADDQGLRPGIWEAAAAPAARVPEGVASGWRALDVTKSVAADLRAGRSQSVFFLEMPELPEEGPCILSVTQLERRDEYAPRFEVRRAE